MFVLIKKTEIFLSAILLVSIANTFAYYTPHKGNWNRINNKNNKKILKIFYLRFSRKWKTVNCDKIFCKIQH